MSAFGKVLGATIAVVLVSKVGLSVAFHADEKRAQHAQSIVNDINSNTSVLAAPYSQLVAAKGADATGIVLNYTVKPDFIASIEQMVEEEVRQKALAAYGQESLNQLISTGMKVVVTFRDQEGQIVKNVTFSNEDLS